METTTNKIKAYSMKQNVVQANTLTPLNKPSTPFSFKVLNKDNQWEKWSGSFTTIKKAKEWYNKFIKFHRANGHTLGLFMNSNRIPCPEDNILIVSSCCNIIMCGQLVCPKCERITNIKLIEVPDRPWSSIHNPNIKHKWLTF